MFLKQLRHRFKNVAFTGGVVLWFAFLPSCLQQLPETVVGCTTGKQCASGKCEGGECVPDDKPLDGQNLDDGLGKLDDAQGDTDPPNDGLGADADVWTPCTDDKNCQHQRAELGPCSSAFCDVDGICKAQPVPDKTPCTKGGICPTKGICNGSACDTTGNKFCDDYNECTVDTCSEDGCSHKDEVEGLPCTGDGKYCTAAHCASGQCLDVVKSGHCLIEGKCYVTGQPDEDDPCLLCQPDDAAAQLAWTPQTNGPCDDGDFCTVADDCDGNSACSGLPIECLDDNPCTTDGCDPVKGCSFLPNTATCTDADPCTVYGTCGDGKCGPGELISCDDGNPCTTDKCEPQIGCVYTPNNAPCTADADPCTNDICLGGACVAKPAANVCKIGGTCVKSGAKADANPCLVCKPALSTKNWTLLVGAACNDGNACTEADVCTDGKCIGEPSACLDSNKCTADSCSPAKGCVFTAIPGSCEDGSKCTVDDKCLAGKCLGTYLEAKDCSDGKVCTTDTCDDKVGCTHTPNNAPCDDGDKCTKGDVCSANTCIAGGVVCPCETNADCSDGNPCTQDVCIKGTGCVNPLADPKKGCDDGNACTSADHCVNGLCQGLKIDCDDQNACTKDSCVAEVGCSYINLQGNACDDSSACTKGDLCLEGWCKGTPKNCDDGDPCTDESCDTGSGTCGHDAAADGSPCTDDSVPCTLDQCHNGKCDHDEIKAEFCLIGNFCYSGGAPHAGKQCLGCQPLKNAKGWSVLVGNGCDDYNACTYGNQCNAQGSCVGKAVDCNDKKPCTKDACNPQAAGGNGCVHLAALGACNDGNKCTADDLCVAGTCLGKAVNCDDANSCTVDSCTPISGCKSAPAANGLACPDDGQPCTVDSCSKGVCGHQPIQGWCVIGGKCWAAKTKVAGKPCLACVPDSNPLDWSFVGGGPCDDGDPCTGSDACLNGGCQGDPDKACDDGNPCTDDSCDAANGCGHKANKASCDDGNACTLSDVCSLGKCQPGPPLQCKQPPNVLDCTLQACDPNQGCVKVSQCGALHICLAGLCVTSATGGGAGPIKVPLAGVNAPQPMRPTLAWQESHSGELGAIPQLWLAAQTSGCAPALGLYSKLFVAGFRPGKPAPELTTLVTPQVPGGGNSWCAAHPVLRPHPTTFNALALGWIEGGGLQSSCSLDKTGGHVRVGLVGIGGHETTLANAAECPAGAGALPMAVRPGLSLLTGDGGGVPHPAQLGGLLFRASKAGVVWYQGSAVTKWGKSLGKLIAPLQVAGAVEVFSGSRPVSTPWTKGSVMFTTSHLKAGQTWGKPVVTAQRFDEKGEAIGGRKVIASGVALVGAEPTYYAVEAAYHGQSKRIGVVISGSVVDGDQLRTFLAFVRVDPNLTAVAGPKVAVYHSQSKTKLKQAEVRSFRVAALPGGDFLVVWAAPGSKVLKAVRIKPSAKPGNDVDFASKEVGTIADTFVSHDDGAVIDSSGGLSEIVLGPALSRYSVAWEGSGAVHLLTAPLPNP